MDLIIVPLFILSCIFMPEGIADEVKKDFKDIHKQNTPADAFPSKEHK